MFCPWQETKSQEVEERLVISVWGASNMRYCVSWTLRKLMIGWSGISFILLCKEWGLVIVREVGLMPVWPLLTYQYW